MLVRLVEGKQVADLAGGRPLFQIGDPLGLPSGLSVTPQHRREIDRPLAQVRYILSENYVTFGAFLLFFVMVIFALLGSAI
ncbi:MAG: hypothetical protein AAF266_04335, partial [Planctomycetota bacterium]